MEATSTVAVPWPRPQRRLPIPFSPPNGHGRSDTPHSRSPSHVHGDIPCVRPAPPCPRRHDRRRSVASSTAVALRYPTSSTIAWPRPRRRTPLPPLRPRGLMHSDVPHGHTAILQPPWVSTGATIAALGAWPRLQRRAPFPLPLRGIFHDNIPRGSPRR